jgi:Fe-S cluster assembly protein SufD
MTATEKPQIVIGRSRRGESTQQTGFNFSPEMVRSGGMTHDICTYRQNAWTIFQQLAMPTTRDEPWRRTDLRHLPVADLQIPLPGAYKKLPAAPKALLKPLTAGRHGGQVVLIPGGARMKLDPEIAAKGVVFTNLRTAEKFHPQLLEKIMGKVINPAEGKFAAMAAALAQDGVLLYVPRGVEIEQPLHSLLWGSGAMHAYFSHILVYLEENASATYVHEAASESQAEGSSLHAGLVEIIVSANASLKFVELQSWGDKVWNFGHERVRVERDARLDWIFGAIGSHLTKNFSELELSGAGASGRISGFYFTNHDQHLDHDTQQNHLAPNTTSDLLFKGALLDQSRSVWQGMIYVAPGAQKADGYQANRNLVLGAESRADSIPGLEILADDVRCTHGATVGKIDPEQVFYLMCRGIPRVEAERLIVSGFFDQIMQRIPYEGVRQRFQNSIREKMKSYHGVSE